MESLDQLGDVHETDIRKGDGGRLYPRQTGCPMRSIKPLSGADRGGHGPPVGQWSVNVHAAPRKPHPLPFMDEDIKMSSVICVLEMSSETGGRGEKHRGDFQGV